MDLFINAVLFVAALIMLGKMTQMSGRNKKAKQIIDIVNTIEDHDLFFAKADRMIQGEDREFAEKAKVLKLWGMAFHKEFDHFEELLADIHPEVLVKINKGRQDIEQNEDSFFYLCLAVENMLEGDHRRDLRKKVDMKMAEYAETLNDQFCWNLQKAVTDFYDEKGDRGLAFFAKVMNGDYGDLRYTKSLIGLYKSIVHTHAYVLYKEAGNTEKCEECMPFIESFADYGVGKRWLKVLKITLPEKKETVDEDVETFRITDESAKKNKE